MEEVAPQPQEALRAIAARRVDVIFCAVVPAALPSFINSSHYSLEKSTRSSVILGLVGARGLTASNWFEELAKPDGSTLYYCVGSTAVTQQAFGMQGVKYDLRGWEMIGSQSRDVRGVAPAGQNGAADRQEQAAAGDWRANRR